MGDLINILIRTHRRPKGFARLLRSIASQTYKNYRIIVSVDDDATLKYVLEGGIDEFNIVRINRDERNKYPNGTAFYNTYFNDLIDAVEDGYVYCMDDDDYFYDEDSLSDISVNLDEDSLCIFKMSIFGTQLPSYSFGRKVTLCDIGTPCFCVHSKYAKQVKWGYSYTADGEYIRDLSGIVPETRWVDEVVYVVENSNQGRAEI